MKQVAYLAIIAVLSVVSMATIYASDFGETPLVVAAPSNEGIGMLGHIEFVLADEFGDIKSYFQTDNFITDSASECIASKLFDDSVTVGGCDTTGDSVKEYLNIRLGNVSAGTTNQNRLNLDDIVGEDMVGFRTDTAAAFSSLDDGDGNTVVTVATEAPFTFADSGGNTTANVFEAGLFDETVGGNAFAIQNTTSGANPGIDVNDGDQLTVTWTITVG